MDSTPKEANEPNASFENTIHEPKYILPPSTLKGSQFLPPKAEVVESKAKEKELSAKYISAEKIGKSVAKYRLGKTIGSGSSGKVKLGIDSTSGEKVRIDFV